MASASTTTAYNYMSLLPNCNTKSSQTNIRVTSILPFSAYFSIPIHRRRLLVMRNSTVGDETATATATATEPESDETSLEIPKGPPSLISVLNVEKALRGIAITDADHYGRLGLKIGCSVDQVNVAYKTKISGLMMNQGLAEEELTEQLELLKESHTILSTVEERRLYDWSLARTDKPDRYMWPFEFDSTPLSTEEPPPAQDPEDVEPTRLLGYFFLTWFILSITLLIAFNR